MDLYQDGLSQLVIDAVAPVLNGYGAAPPAPGDHGDGRSGITAQGKQKGVQLLVVGIDTANGIFLAFLGIQQRQFPHRTFPLG